MKIRNNIASLNSLRNTSASFKAVQESLEKLSSGQKINRGADGPASLIASEGLRSRVAGLQQSHQNNQIAVSLIQTAEGALNEVSDILIQLKQLAVHAVNEAVNDPMMMEADQQEAEYLLAALDRITQNTSFAGKKLLDGSMGVSGVTVGDNLRFVKAEVNTNPSPEKGFSIDISQVATRANFKGTEPLTVDNIGEGMFILVNEGGRNASLDTRSGKIKVEIDEILNNHRSDPERFPAETSSEGIRSIVIHHLQEAMDKAGVNVEVFQGPDQTFILRHREYGDDPSFSVTTSTPGILTAVPNEAEKSTPGTDVAGTIDGEVAQGEGRLLTALEGTAAQGVTVEYTRDIELKEVPILNDQGIQVGSEFVEETHEEVVGSASDPKIEGYLHVSQQSKMFNLGPDNSFASVSIGEVRASKLGSGIENKSEILNLGDIDLTEIQSAKDSIRVIDKAISDISNYRAKLGAFQKNTLERNLANLQVGAENNVAGESVIRDTDVAEEMSRLTSNQILLSAGQSMLAQANQMPRNVLRLLESGGGGGG